MSSTNPRVRSILAAHPHQFVVICVAGCDGKPRPVQVLPRPVERRVGQFVPTAARSGKGVYGSPGPWTIRGFEAADGNDVVCVAGCSSRAGQILQRVSGLPPPRPAPAVSKDVLPKMPVDESIEGSAAAP